MVIPKYSNPEWFEFIIKECKSGNPAPALVDGYQHSYAVDGGWVDGFLKEVILNLKKISTGDIVVHEVVDWRGYYRDGKYEWTLILRPHGSLNQENFTMTYDPNDETTKPIIISNDHKDDKYELIFTDINPEWNIQLAKIKLAFAMLLNDRLSSDSPLNDRLSSDSPLNEHVNVNFDIIEQIAGNINNFPESLKEDKVIGSKGGGRRRRRKTKRRKNTKKSKRKKSKRRKKRSKSK